MPELPEVETTRLGIKEHIKNREIFNVIVRQAQLRWPIPGHLKKQLVGQSFKQVNRRAKYLLLETNNKDTVIIHLGMSGNLRFINQHQPHGKHDHVDFVFSDQSILRFNDTRRFGAILLTSTLASEHKLLSKLGPEPLTHDFSGDYLYQKAQNKKVCIKSFLMDSHIVVGVGNIYANEALFMSGIHPNRQAGRISKQRYHTLVKCVKQVLQKAIDQGGTTLRDFVNGQGKPGYFQQSLTVYGRQGEKCRQCGSVIKQVKIAQRASFYCANCQH